MINVLFVFSYLMFPFIIYLLMKANGLSIFKLTIPSFVILWMFVSAYIGTIVLYFGWDDYRYASGVTSMAVFLLVFCFSILALYISKIPRVAFVVDIVDGYSEAKLARSLMGNDFAGKYHRYHLVMHHMLNLVTYGYEF